MTRLPIPGRDNGNWGQILNDYLSVEHNSDGSLKLRTDGSFTPAVADGSITASKLSSSVNNYLASAQTAVQSVNGETGQAITLTAADVSAVSTSAVGAASGVATLDGSSKLTTSQLPTSVATSSEARLRAALALGKQNVVEMTDVPPLVKQLTLTYSSIGGGSLANLISGGYSQLASDTSAVHVKAGDSRIKVMGANTGAYPGTTSYNDLSGNDLFYCAWYPVSGSPGYSRFDTLAYYAVDVVASELEFIIYGTTSQKYRVWIDGQPHTSTPVSVTKNDGLIWLMHIALPRGRDRYTVMIECDEMLFGGFLHNPVDSLLPPTGLGTGPAVLIIGDSYSTAANLDAKNSWALRLAWRLGFDRVYICGTGGRGINVDADENPGTTGYKYQAHLEHDRSNIPNDVALIINQGTTNDGNFSTGSGALQTALAASCQSLWDYERQEWPNAVIVQTSTMRCANATANDAAANTIYSTQVGLRSDVIYVDAQGSQPWFSGTGTEAAPTGNGNADYLIQSDASHPTALGHKEIADRLASALTSSATSSAAKKSVRRRRYQDGLPGIFTPGALSMGGTSTPTITAQRAYYNRFVTDDQLKVTGIGCVLTTAATNDDGLIVGIFNSTGTVIAQSGPLTGYLNQSTAGGAVALKIPLSVTLDPETVYYVGLVCPTVGGTGASLMFQLAGNFGLFKLFGTSLPNLVCCQEASVTTFSGRTITPAFLTGQNPILAIRTD